MTTILDLLTATSALEEARSGTAAIAAQTSEKIRENMRALKERIEAGESTGSSFKDFVILHYWQYSSQERQRIESEFHSLDAALKGKQGQMVLIVKHFARGSGRHTFNKGWQSTEIAEELCLAKLMYEEIHFRDTIGKPGNNLWTGKHRALLLVYGPYALLNNEGNPRLNCRKIDASAIDVSTIHYTETLVPDNVFLYGDQRDPLPAWEVIVGDAEVEAWFQGRAEALGPIRNSAEAILLQFERMADIIGKPLDAERYPRLAQYRQRMQILARRKAFLALAECVKHYTPEEMRAQENNVSHPPAPAQKPAFCAALKEARDAGAEIADLVSLAKEFGMDIDPSKLKS